MASDDETRRRATSGLTSFFRSCRFLHRFGSAFVLEDLLL